MSEKYIRCSQTALSHRKSKVPYAPTPRARLSDDSVVEYTCAGDTPTCGCVLDDEELLGKGVLVHFETPLGKSE